jgi:hypothetical protein
MKLRLIGNQTYIYKGYYFERGGGDLKAISKEDHDYLMEQKLHNGSPVFKEVAEDAAPEPTKVEVLPESDMKDRRIPASERVPMPAAKTKTLVINSKGEGDSAAPIAGGGGDGGGDMELGDTGVKV